MGSVPQGRSVLLTVKLVSPLHLHNGFGSPRRTPSYPGVCARISSLQEPEANSHHLLFSSWAHLESPTNFLSFSESFQRAAQSRDDGHI